MNCGTDMPAPLPGACAKLDSQTQYPTLDLSLFPEDAVGPGKGEASTTSAGQETLRPRPAIQQPDKPLRLARRIRLLWDIERCAVPSGRLSATMTHPASGGGGGGCHGTTHFFG